MAAQAGREMWMLASMQGEATTEDQAVHQI